MSQGPGRGVFGRLLKTCHHEIGHANTPGQTPPQHFHIFPFADGSAMFAVRHRPILRDI